MRVVPVIVNEEAKHTIPRRLRKIQWLDLSDPKEYDTRLRRFASHLVRIAAPARPHEADVVQSDRPSGEVLGGQFAGIDMDELVRRIANEVAAHLNVPSNRAAVTSSTSQSKKGNEEARSVFVVMA